MKNNLKFKTALYESLVNGKLDNDEYKIYKKQYALKGGQLQAAINSLEMEIENIKGNRSERLKWINRFKQFSNLDELDRSVIIQLIKSIRVVGKTNLDITFNYEFENKKAVIIFTGESKSKVVV